MCYTTTTNAFSLSIYLSVATAPATRSVMAASEAVDAACHIPLHAARPLTEWLAVASALLSGHGAVAAVSGGAIVGFALRPWGENSRFGSVDWPMGNVLPSRRGIRFRMGCARTCRETGKKKRPSLRTDVQDSRAAAVPAIVGVDGTDTWPVLAQGAAQVQQSR